MPALIAFLLFSFGVGIVGGPKPAEGHGVPVGRPFKILYGKKKECYLPSRVEITYTWKKNRIYRIPDRAPHSGLGRALPPGLHEHRDTFTTTEIVDRYHPEYMFRCTTWEGTDCETTWEYDTYECPVIPLRSEGEPAYQTAKACNDYQDAFDDKNESDGTTVTYYRRIIGTDREVCQGERIVD